MNIIGIDPGLKGGIAVIPFYDFKRTVTYSLEDYSLSQLALLFQEFRVGGGVLYEQEKDTHCEVYLEEPQLPMLNTQNNNNFSVQAHKKLARSLGQLEGICIAAGYPPNLLSPRKWQTSLNCLTKGNKNISKNLAVKVFPFLSRYVQSGPNAGLLKSTVTHATADALLIALYGYLQYQDPSRYPLPVKQHIDSIKITRKILPLGQELPEPDKEIILFTSENEILGRVPNTSIPTKTHRPRIRGQLPPPSKEEAPPTNGEIPNGRTLPNQHPPISNRNGPYRPNSRPGSPR